MKRYLYIFILVFSSLCKMQGQTSGWEISGYLPHGIKGAEAVVMDSTIYIFGGVNDSVQRVTNWIYSFNPSTNEISILNHMRKNRSHFTAGTSDSLIYIVGGEFNQMGHPGGFVECYNPLTNTITTIDSNQKFNRWDAAGIIRNNKIYLAGGAPQYPYGSIPYLLEYSISERAFTYTGNYYTMGFPKEQIPAFINDQFYLIGGAYNTVLRDIFRYNINTHYFKKQMPGLLTVRAGGRAVYFSTDSTKVMVLGGHNEIDHAMNSVEVYDLSDTANVTSWVLPHMNFERKEFMAVNFGNYIYVFGGVSEMNIPVLAVERYQYITTTEEDKNIIPGNFQVDQNYPNPFNPSTTIGYSLPSRSHVYVKVFNTLGKEISELVNKEEEAGMHKVSFNGNGLTSGIYFYRVTINNNSFTRKMILLK